jgi:hypothetical protein
LADVNNKEDLLPGYHLNLHWNDSGVRQELIIIFHVVGYNTVCITDLDQGNKMIVIFHLFYVEHQFLWQLGQKQKFA